MEAPKTIPWGCPNFWGREQEYVLDAMKSTWVSGGPYVERLERDFATYTGMRYAFAVSNGTTALHLAYLALELKPGDEIIVPGFMFMAAANVATHLGVKPVFAEVDPDTWCMRAEDVEPLLNSKTRAIVPVHTYGNVCAMEPILTLACSHQIPVIEDAAESFPSRYQGKISGTLGALGSYSFQATKTITTGEGGMVVTNDPKFIERLALYRSHGMARKDRYYWHEVPGHNFRLANPLAAMGVAQLEQIDKIITARRSVHRMYTERLKRIPGVTLQKFATDVDPVLWVMAVRLDRQAFRFDRDTVIRQLRVANVETRPGFYTPHQLPIYKSPAMPVCDALAESIISLPTFPTLTEEQIEYICQQLASFRR